MIPPVSTERRGDELQTQRPTSSPSADLTTYLPGPGTSSKIGLVEWSRTDHVTLPADNPIMGGHLLTRVPGPERVTADPARNLRLATTTASGSIAALGQGLGEGPALGQAYLVVSTCRDGRAFPPLRG
jgi:hypothetical protein